MAIISFCGHYYALTKEPNLYFQNFVGSHRNGKVRPEPTYSTPIPPITYRAFRCYLP